MVNNLEEFAKNVSVFAITTFVSFKWLYIRSKMNKIYEFVDKMNSDTAEPQDDVEMT